MLDEYMDAPDRSAPGEDDLGIMPSTRRRLPRRRRNARRHRNGGRNWWLALAVAGVLLVGGAYWAGTKATSPSALGKQYAAPPPSVLTAPVVLRRLSETIPVQGTVTTPVGYQVNFGSVSVPGAQPIVTAKPAGPPAVVANGSLLAQVAGRPVFAMLGVTPMYRDLTIGDRGPDVVQLQEDLAALSFPSGDAPGIFGKGTLRAVRAFYGKAGYSLPQSPSTQSAFATPMTAQGTPSARATSPQPSGSPSPSAASATPSPTSPTVSPSASASSPPPVVPPAVVPQAEVVFIPTLPARIQSSSLKLGLPITNPALTLSTAELEVIVPLTDAQVSLVQPKDTATLTIVPPGGAATEVAATVSAVHAAGQDPQSGSVAVLRPSRPLGWSLAGHQAAGEIVIASTSTEVLAVPVAALFTAGDGSTLVTVVAPHGKRTSVPVRVGAEIGGFVPVQPIQGHLASGDLVLVGE